jgi:hypothetical protein
MSELYCAIVDIEASTIFLLDCPEKLSVGVRIDCHDCRGDNQDQPGAGRVITIAGQDIKGK